MRRSSPAPILQSCPIPSCRPRSSSPTMRWRVPMAPRPTVSTNGNVFLYNLQITQNGLLSFSYSVNGGAYTPVISSQSITASNGALPAHVAFRLRRFDRRRHQHSRDPVFQGRAQHRVGQLGGGQRKADLAGQTTSQAYFAFYNPNDWTGRVAAYGLVDTAGHSDSASSPTGMRECVLTGVVARAPVPTSQRPRPDGRRSARNWQPPVMLTMEWARHRDSAGTLGIPFDRWAPA
jgi:type IV pilus assembly protein PilY1